AAASACASKAAPLASRASLRRMRLARRLDPALVPFLWSRAAIWGAAILFAFWLAPDRPRRHGPTPGGNGYWLHLWANWDGAWFAQIAQHGYATTAGTGAFYPLYPAALAVLGRVFAGHYVAARDARARGLPAVVLPAGRLQRVVLPRARSRRVPCCAHGTLDARRRRDRARVPHAADCDRALARAAPARVARARAPARARLGGAGAARVRALPAPALAADRRRARVRARRVVLASQPVVARADRRARRRHDAGRLELSGEPDEAGGRRRERRGVLLARPLLRAGGRRVARARRGLRRVRGRQPARPARRAVAGVPALLAAALRARDLSVLHGARRGDAHAAASDRARRDLRGAARRRRRPLGALVLGGVIVRLRKRDGRAPGLKQLPTAHRAVSPT